MSVTTGVLTIYTEKPEIPGGKSNGTFHSVRNIPEKVGGRLRRSTFPCSFRFSRLGSVPFQLPAFFKIFHARQNKMAENEGNAGEFENFQITSLKSILLRMILIPL